MQIPKYEPQIKTTVRQTPSPQKPADFSQISQANQELGQQIQNVGKLIQQRSLERQQEKDTQQVIDTETTYKKEISDLRMKYENRKLNSAYDVTKDFDTEAAKVKNKYLATLAGETQKTVFGQMADKFHNDNLTYMAKYERQETDKSKINTLNDAAAASAAIIAKDPDRLQAESESIVNKNNVVLKQLGYSQEDIDRENEKVKSNFISTSIGTYLQTNQLNKAKQQFEENKELIFKNNPEGFYKIQDAIEKGNAQLVEDKIKFNNSNAANIQDEKSFNLIIADNNRLVDTLNLTDEAKTNLKRQYADVAITEQVNTKINIQKDIEGATKFFGKHQNEMSPDKAADLKTAIDAKSFSLKMDDAFKTYQTYKLVDGSIDMGKVYKDLESKYSGDDLEKAKSEIEQRTADFERVRDSRRNAGIVNGQNTIAGAKNYSEAFSWLKRNKSGYENRDYQSLLDYAQNVFNVDKNGNPRGAGGKKPQTDLGAWLLLKEGLSNGQTTQNDIIKAYNSGLLSDGDFKSLSSSVIRSGFQQKEIMTYIKQKANELYPKNKDDRNQFIYYYSNISKDKQLPDVITMIENGQGKVKTGWFGLGGETAWKSDLETQNQNNKEWANYSNRLGSNIMNGLQIGLSSYYKTNQLNSTILADFNNKIGGLNTNTISAIRFLYDNKQPITPDNVNALVKKAQEKEQSKPKPKPKQSENSLASGMAAAYLQAQERTTRR